MFKKNKTMKKFKLNKHYSISFKTEKKTTFSQLSQKVNELVIIVKIVSRGAVIKLNAKILNKKKNPAEAKKNP